MCSSFNLRELLFAHSVFKGLFKHLRIQWWILSFNFLESLKTDAFRTENCES